MNKPVILIITHVIPYPPSAGNEIRILKMMAWLRSLGLHIVLLLNHRPAEDVIAGLRTIADEVHIAGDYKVTEQAPLQLSRSELLLGLATRKPLLKSLLGRTGLLEHLEYKAKAAGTRRWLCPQELLVAASHLNESLRPDVVLAEYIFTARCLDIFPASTYKIIDTHDMFSRKKEQVLDFGIKDPLLCTEKEERGLLLKSDLIIAIQDNEADMFRRLVPERKVVTVGIDFEVSAPPSDAVTDPATVLVVGSESPLNVHGLKEFYQQAWPRIRKACNGATLKIIGKVGNHLEVSDQSVVKLGWVESLEAEYHRATVVINPIPSGTGLKIKSVEALCLGKALVSTANGVEGISAEPGCDTPYICCSSWDSFADATVSLLQSGEKRRALENTAIAYAREKFSTQQTYASLLQALPLQGATPSTSPSR
ncbi:glycosyltransferase family 4 protein [Geomonas anaerohicana]|uniref:Glycosyltransferase family 4 protein n=1 Tax=Geomonas anaerohicana TaxID=2798583 RepID=A0ABS0YH35_9BACT|nr:glycosyltransferase family 4 protein [Geomonas anaerohicana]MBJ6751581.1 glycosyltransferase family 4 protein [Geomonas anaerohicana]